MASEKVKNYRKRKLGLQILSWCLCFGSAAVFIIMALAGHEPNEEMVGVLNDLKTLGISAIITLIPMIVLSIIAKDKFKPTVWMVDIIMANILVGDWMMFITFGLWIFDNYFVSRKIKQYETRIITREELDRG